MVNLIHLKPGGEEALGTPTCEYMWPALLSARRVTPSTAGDVTFRAARGHLWWCLETSTPTHWSDSRPSFALLRSSAEVTFLVKCFPETYPEFSES